ncbi:MAG TPA: DUF2796 domain-containing protein [Burkholderiales bacterium]|nr:DUF2796 domain-containing protein [Burkholderiales bacterium]
MSKLKAFRLFCLCFAAASAGALAHGPHVHGTGELHVAIEDDKLSIELHGPLENLLGFEHPPRTDSQRAAVKAMTAKLDRPETLFKLPPAASCRAGPTRVDSPLDGATAPSKSVEATHGDDDDDHADLTATFAFVCANIGKLDSIEVTVFGAFPGTRVLKAEIIGPRGQSAANLSADRRVIRF